MLQGQQSPGLRDSPAAPKCVVTCCAAKQSISTGFVQQQGQQVLCGEFDMQDESTHVMVQFLRVADGVHVISRRYSVTGGKTETAGIVC